MRRVVAGVAAAVLAAAGFAAYARGPSKKALAVASGDAHPMAFFDLATFRRAEAGLSPAGGVGSGARAVVVPHHWLAAPLIVAGLRDLASSEAVTRVVLVGPNHSGAGGAPLTTDDRAWVSPRGRVAADASAVARLRRAGAVVRPSVLQAEHSIAGLVPAVALMMPRASIAVVAVAGGAGRAAFDGLVAALTDLLRDPGTAIVASVDFSHGQTAPDAARYDAQTRRALEEGASSRILGWGNEHLDSPETVAAVIAATNASGASRFTLGTHSTSVAFGASPSPPNITSYFVGFWSAAR